MLSAERRRELLRKRTRRPDLQQLIERRVQLDAEQIRDIYPSTLNDYYEYCNCESCRRREAERRTSELKTIDEKRAATRRAESLLSSVLYECQYEDWLKNHRFSFRTQFGTLMVYSGVTLHHNLYYDDYRSRCIGLVNKEYMPRADDAVCMFLLFSGSEKLAMAHSFPGAPGRWYPPTTYGGQI